MASFQEPSVHDVETIGARIHTLSNSVCVTLAFNGHDMYGDTGEAQFKIFLPLSHADYATALVEAINSVTGPGDVVALQRFTDVPLYAAE